MANNFTAIRATVKFNRHVSGSRRSVFIFVTMCFAFVGCSKSNKYDVVPIAGTLLFEGKPVSGMRILFSPEEGRSSIATTDVNGKFRPWYRAREYGVQKGTHKIILERNIDDTEILGETGPPSKNHQKLLEIFGHGGHNMEIVITKSTSDLTIDLIEPVDETDGK